MQVYFLGDTNTRGTYYFHSAQLRGWVVADLDTGKASLHDELATIRLEGELTDPKYTLDRKGVALGSCGAKYLVDGSLMDMTALLRDHGEDIEILVYLLGNGRVLSGKAADEAFRGPAALAKKLRRKYD
jgi:hypothetical protein